MMYHHKFKIGAHIVLSPPRGQIVGFSVRAHPHTGDLTTYYDLMTPHGPIDNVPEDAIHFYEPGMKYAPDPMVNDPLLPQRGDIEHAETLSDGAIEPEPTWPTTDDPKVNEAVDSVQAGLLGALGVQEVNGTFRPAMAPVPGDGDAGLAVARKLDEERRKEDVGFLKRGASTGTRSTDAKLPSGADRAAEMASSIRAEHDFPG